MNWQAADPRCGEVNINLIISRCLLQGYRTPVIPACRESFFEREQGDSRQAGMTRSKALAFRYYVVLPRGDSLASNIRDSNNHLCPIQTVQGNFSLRANSPLCQPRCLYGISAVFKLYMWARRYSPTADNPGARLQKNNPVLSELESRLCWF